MAIQIRGVQIQDNSVGPTQIDETATYDFSSGVVSVATPTASAHAATKAYVDSQVGDGFQAGDGIAIDTGTSPDTISVNLKANQGLSFQGTGTDELGVLLKSESGGTISVDSSGLYIADSAIGNAKLAGSIANAKLANSTISGVALGSNLNSLAPATNGGVLFTSYNGSAAVSDLQLDISDLADAAVAVGADSIAIYDADGDVTGKESIADLATAMAGQGISATSGVFAVDYQSRQDVLTPNGSTAAFALANEVPSYLDNMVMVFRNGLLQKKVASSPADDSEYTVTTSAGTTTVTFGANINSADALEVRYLA